MIVFLNITLCFLSITLSNECFFSLNNVCNIIS